MKLRERKAQPVYLSGAAFSGADDTIDLEGVVGSSARVRREPELPAEGSSDSDYEPDDKNDVSSQGDEVEEAGAEIEDEELSDSSLRQIEGTPPKSHKVSPAKPSRARAAPKPKTSKGQPNKSSNPGVLSISGPSRATQKAAAIPAGANVRHKPLPLYVLPEVSRLLERPSPFSHGNTTPTNPSSGKICERVNKSWAHSVGAGPEWRLLEDRAWWKEGVGEGIDAYGEQCGRPRVYEEVSWVDSMDALSEKWVDITQLCNISLRAAERLWIMYLRAESAMMTFQTCQQRSPAR